MHKFLSRAESFNKLALVFRNVAIANLHITTKDVYSLDIGEFRNLFGDFATVRVGADDENRLVAQVIVDFVCHSLHDSSGPYIDYLSELFESILVAVNLRIDPEHNFLNQIKWIRAMSPL